MIIVSGTKRSGTSLWMHLLATAGVPVIGERFPFDWEDKIKQANPLGFYESQLVHGVYHQTNPHPETGDYLRPEQVQQHAVKVFIPGLIRTDLAFIGRVLVTVRPWRAYIASAARLDALVRPMANFDPDALTHAQMPPALAWWSENFALIRDAATRGYPIHVVSLERLRADPQATLAETLGWLGVQQNAPQIDALATIVHPTNKSDPAGPSGDNHIESSSMEGFANTAVMGIETHGLDAPTQQVFDALYDTMHRGADFTTDIVKTLNHTDAQLRPQILQHIAQARIEAARRLLGDEKH